jgi:hypothetical protein
VIFVKKRYLSFSLVVQNHAERERHKKASSVEEVQIVEKEYFSRQFFCIIGSLLNGRLISAPGASLSAGRALSLLVAVAPAGSHLTRCSRRSLRTFRSNQPRGKSV